MDEELDFVVHNDLLNFSEDQASFSSADQTRGGRLSADELAMWLSKNVVEVWMDASSQQETFDGSPTTFILGDRHFPLCNIHLAVVNEVRPSIIRKVIAATGCLPSIMHPMCHQAVLRGFILRFEPRTGMPAILVSAVLNSEPVQDAADRACREHQNTLQLFHMGLTGDATSRGQILDSFRARKAALRRAESQLEQYKVNLKVSKEDFRSADRGLASMTTFYRLVSGRQHDIVVDLERCYAEFKATLEETEQNDLQKVRHGTERVQQVGHALAKDFQSSLPVLGVPVIPVDAVSWDEMSRPVKSMNLLPRVGYLEDHDSRTSLLPEPRVNVWTRRLLAFNEECRTQHSPTTESKSGNVRLYINQDGVPNLATHFPTTIDNACDEFGDFVANDDDVDILPPMDPIMHLPQVIATDITKDSDSGVTNCFEYTASELPFGTLEDEPSPLDTTTDAIHINPLSVVWPWLSLCKRQELLGRIARLLCSVWINFDILDDESSSRSQDSEKCTMANVSLAPDEPLCAALEDTLKTAEADFMNQSYGKTPFEPVAMPWSPKDDAHTQTRLNGTECDVPINGTAGTHPRQMTTTKADAVESLSSGLDISVKVEDTGCNHMRQFDFSLDDLLVADGDTTQFEQRVFILGVCRWKQFSSFSMPWSSFQDWHNWSPTQEYAAFSAYPLIHLFTPPRMFCPSAGHRFLREEWYQLVEHVSRISTSAAQFMLDPPNIKECKLYHRWMAAWHARSPKAPLETVARMEFLRANHRERTVPTEKQKMLPLQRIEHQWERLSDKNRVGGRNSGEARLLDSLLENIGATLQIRQHKHATNAPNPLKHSMCSWRFGLQQPRVWKGSVDTSSDESQAEERSPNDADGLQNMRPEELAELEHAVRSCRLSCTEQDILDRYFCQANQAASQALERRTAQMWHLLGYT
ncbi:hypothetical protein BGZ94_000866 [Podila epigama]|nr:hypothetical protein BGZ94_000866 [Podila epigama]